MLAHVVCFVTHNECHRKDSSDCDKAKPEIDLSRREIRPEGDMTGDHRAVLLAIANKCPVRPTLHGLALIETELAWTGPMRMHQ